MDKTVSHVMHCWKRFALITSFERLQYSQILAVVCILICHMALSEKNRCLHRWPSAFSLCRTEPVSCSVTSWSAFRSWPFTVTMDVHLVVSKLGFDVAEGGIDLYQEHIDQTVYDI